MQRTDLPILSEWQVLHDPEAETEGVQILQKERGKAMSRYIERDKLISNLKELPEQERIEYMGIYDCIRSQPTADVVEVRHGKWTLSVRSFYRDTYSEESELSVYIIASCSECGEKYPNGNISGQIFSEIIYAPEGKEYGYKFDEIYERQKVLDKFNLIDYNFKKYCPNCGARMDGETNDG